MEEPLLDDGITTAGCCCGLFGGSKAEKEGAPPLGDSGDVATDIVPTTSSRARASSKPKRSLTDRLLLFGGEKEKRNVEREKKRANIAMELHQTERSYLTVLCVAVRMRAACVSSACRTSQAPDRTVQYACSMFTVCPVCVQ